MNQGTYSKALREVEARDGKESMTPHYVVSNSHENITDILGGFVTSCVRRGGRGGGDRLEGGCWPGTRASLACGEVEGGSLPRLSPRVPGVWLGYASAWDFAVCFSGNYRLTF